VIRPGAAPVRTTGVATDFCAPHRLTRYWQMMRVGG
jgi:hypothetical protein